MGKVVVMGGSFNPPTVAHRELMKSALDSVGAYQGIFVPAPYRYVQRKMEKRNRKSMVLPGTIRFKMLESFCREDERLAVSDFELGKELARTIDTMKEVQRQHPNDNIYFIAGADKLHIIPRWSRIDEFLAEFKILVAARDGENPNELISADPYLRSHESAFEVFHVPEELSEISSSRARRLLENQSPKAEQMFNREIWEILTVENAQMYFGICRFREENDYLSNFYEVPVEYDGIIYRNNETAFQAQKVLNEEERREFADLPANKAKKLGRGVQLRPDWEEVKLDLMYRIVKGKFTQNPALGQRLLNTGQCLLTEGNTWHDTFWGVDLTTAQGENHLGKILMRVREELK